jgi:hypothetical protein
MDAAVITISAIAVVIVLIIAWREFESDRDR